MKITDVKKHYKIFVRKLIEEHDTDVYTINEIKSLCETHGCKTTADKVRQVLTQYAERVKWGKYIYWGNKTAIKEFKKTVGL